MVPSKMRKRVIVFLNRNLRREWFSEPLGNPDYLTIIIFLRFIALLCLVSYFGFNKVTYDDRTFLEIKFTLITFFLYLCILFYTRSFTREWFLSEVSIWGQVFVDGILFSLIYFQTGDIRSDIYFLYFFPLFISVEYFSIYGTLGGLALTLLLFTITLAAIDSHSVHWFMNTLLPRQMFMIVFISAFLYRRRLRVSANLKRQHKLLATRLENIEDGVYVINEKYHLLFINNVLVQRHGSLINGEKCFSFFFGSKNPCEGCRCTKMSGAQGFQSLQEKIKKICIDKNKQKYLAEMVQSPLIFDSTTPTMFVGFLKDITKKKELMDQVEQYLNQAEQAADVLTRELRQKNNLLSRQLASIFSATLRPVEADMRETLSRMLNVTMEVLGCQSGTIRLIGKDPEGCVSLVLELDSGLSPIWVERRKFLNLNEKSFAVDCYLSKQPSTHRNVLNDSMEKIYREYARQSNLHSASFIPLILRDKCFGTLSLYRQTSREFSPEEMLLGQSIANSIAIVIENFRLYEEKSLQAAEQRRWLDAIHQVSIQLAGFENLDALLDLTVQITKERLNSEISSIFLVEEDRARKKATSGVEKEWFSEESYGIGEGLTGSCLKPINSSKYGKHILTNTVDQDPRVTQENLAKYQAKLQSRQVKHLLAVPLNGNEGPFGILRVVNKLDKEGRLQGTGFTEDDVNLITTIACEVAIAVEKVRLLQETQQHVYDLSLLQHSSHALLSSLDIKSVLNKIAALAVNVAQADCAEVVIEENGELIIGAHSSLDLSSLTGKPRPNGITRKILDTGKPVIIDEIQDNGKHNSVLLEKGVESYAGIPIFGQQDRILGVLFVFSLRPHAFREKIHLLETFVSQATSAIKNSKLFELEQKRRILADALREASKVLNSTLDLDHVLRLILDQVQSVVPYDTASVLLLDSDNLRIIACRGFEDQEYIKTLAFPISPEFPNYQTVENKKPYIVDDVTTRYAPFQDEFYRATHVRSWLGVPLLFQNQVVGMMSLDNKEIGFYHEEHAQLALTFANQAAVAIQNARLYQEKRDRLSESTALLDTSKRLTEVLDHQQLLQLIIDSAEGLIKPAEGGVVHLLDENTKKLLPAAARHVDRAELEQATLMELGRGIAGHSIKNLQTIRVDDVELDSRFDQFARVSYFSSLLVAPMYVGHKRKRIGTLSVHSQTKGAFNDTHERLLTTLASQAAIAIANAELFTIRQQKRVKLQEIIEVYQVFDVDIGMDNLLKRIAMKAREILGFNLVVLKIVDSTDQNLVVRAIGDPDKDWQNKVIGTPIPLANVKKLMQEKYKISRSYLLWDREPLWNEVAERHVGTITLNESAVDSWFPDIAVIIPLETQDDRLIGVIALGDPYKEQLPSQDDIQVSEIFASVASAAIENARLFEAEKRRATHMAVSSDVAQNVTSVLELKKLLPRIVESIQRGFNYQHVALFLFDENINELVVHANAGDYVNAMPHDHHLPLGKGLVGWAAHTFKTQLANDVRKSQHYVLGFHPAAITTRSELSVPLYLPKKLIGVLDIQSTNVNAFDETDVLAMETLSVQIAVAIDNARLFSEVQQLSQFNEKIIQDMDGGVLVEDVRGYITFMNPKMATMLGYTQNELIYKHWSKIVPTEWIGKVTEETKKRTQNIKGRYEAALLHRNGDEIPVVINANPLFEKGEFTGVLTVFTDIRETKRRFEDELHETMNFLHAGVMLEIETTKERLENGQYELLMTELDQTWRASRYTYFSLENMLQDLRDPVLEREGLGAALERYAELVARDIVTVKADFRGRLLPDTEHALYRIAQGAITNSVKHAKLEQVQDGNVIVRLKRNNAHIILCIEDNGVGFDVAIMKEFGQAFGLVRMQEWAETLGTSLQIESVLDEGTKVMVIAPLEEVIYEQNQNFNRR